MPDKLPYPLPPRGPLRELHPYLHNGMLAARDAEFLLGQGLSWTLLARFVHDRAWWRSQRPAQARPLVLPWRIHAWGATLNLGALDQSIWIDPGPESPWPAQPPDLIIVTHAHHDHTARLGEFSARFPDAWVAMTQPTAALLSLRTQDHQLRDCLEKRTICLRFGEMRTLSGVQLTLWPAGHLLGAAMIEMSLQQDRLLITGDFALRDVGGLAGAWWPQNEYGLVVIESTLADRGSPPFADPESNRRPFLDQVAGLLDEGRTRLVVTAQAMGQAQELYAALVMAQRAGAFPALTVGLDGMAANVSQQYDQVLRKEPGPWSCGFDTVQSPIPDNSVVITGSAGPGDARVHDVTGEREPDPTWHSHVLQNPPVYTHAGWAERMALATGVACHRIAFYHGYSLSLDTALTEIDRQILSVSAEAEA